MDRTLLAPIRLSRKTDASLNPEGQRERITDYAEDNGDTVIWADVDMDVSGAVPIRERPGFGSWLAPDKIAQIDGFCGDEMDRLSRDMLDYLQFARDMARLGKIIIDVSDGTDTSTERGRQTLEDRVLGAQREREKMQSRRRKAHDRAKTAGRWDGGVIPFGYSPLCICHDQRPCPEPVVKHRKGWRLVQGRNAETAKWMVQQRISGKGFDAIAAELNADGIPASRGGKWRGTAVRKILTSPLLLGQETEEKNGVQVVRRGKDGQPVMFTDEPLIDRDTWDLLQDAIKAGSRAPGQPQSRHLLYRVLFCRACSPQPFDPDTAVRMYGGRRYKAGLVTRRESIQFTSQDQLSALGALILAERNDAGLSLARLSKLTMIDDSSLSRIERGFQQPSVRALRLIAGAFGLTAEALLAEIPGAEMLPEREFEQPHHAYYTCKSCGLHIRLDRVEPLIVTLIMKEVGDRVLLERRIIRGDDHQAAITRLERAAERRRELLADDPGDEDMARSLAAMDAQIEELKRQPHEADQTEWREVESGITVAQHWASLDTAGRAKFLRDWEVVALADRHGMEVTLGWLEVYSDAFKLADNRLCPANLPALITHSRDWQQVPGGVLPAVVAHQLHE